jgi:rfaE bifunctional protein nucleotidyltransferase chain/domain
VTSSPILLGADHNGVLLKSTVAGRLRESGLKVIDLGTYVSDTPVDYVDYARQLSHIISVGDADFGILICGTGVGMSIVANRFPGVRAALVHNVETSILAREHNNSNVLCLRAWKNTSDENLAIVERWVTAKFGERRHLRRTTKIDPADCRKVVFTNGCFDLIHGGHIELLNFAKRLGGKLVVGLNSDRSVRQLKGNGRPINCEEDRRKVLESIKAVDEVVVFDDVSTRDILSKIEPDVVVKGGEWEAEEVRHRDGIPDEIEVIVCPLKPGYSTTSVIEACRTE